MKYKIGEVAKLLGVSIEAIRFFEKRGLINPTRDEISGYRMYSAAELNVLMRIRGYAKCGFTLAETASLIEACDLDGMASRLGERAEKLESEILYQQALLKCLRMRQEHLHRVTDMVGRSVIERSPTFYGIIYRFGQLIPEDEDLREQVREWVERKPFAETLLIFPKGYLEGRKESYLHGLCMEECFARFFDVVGKPGVVEFPSRRAVYSIDIIPYEHTLEKRQSIQFFSAARRYINEQGLRIVGDSYGRTIHSTKASGEYVHYSEQWIPVE